MFKFPSLYDVIVMLPAVILGLTLHEYAHGWMAERLGDHTARNQGRLTLNPMAHLDPVGFFLLFIANFGWAKPVPVNPYNMKIPVKQGMLLVSLAGPLMNMLLAVISAALLGLVYNKFPYLTAFLYQMIYTNLILAVFNLIPVPPLDGSKILAGLLPGRQEWLIVLEQYGTLVLLILIFTGITGYILRLLINPLAGVLQTLAQYVANLSL